jgi:hypothetical protein
VPSARDDSAFSGARLAGSRDTHQTKGDVATFRCQSSLHALSLDEDGVCLSVEPDGDPDVAACVGAQFVATLDPEAPGLLGNELRDGVSLLLVKVLDARGRVKMLRFGPLVRCEAQPASHPTIPTEDDPTLRDLAQAIARDVDGAPATPRLSRRRDSGFLRKPDEEPTLMYTRRNEPGRVAGAPRIRRRRNA